MTAAALCKITGQSLETDLCTIGMCLYVFCSTLVAYNHMPQCSGQHRERVGGCIKISVTISDYRAADETVLYSHGCYSLSSRAKSIRHFVEYRAEYFYTVNFSIGNVSESSLTASHSLSVAAISTFVNFQQSLHFCIELPLFRNFCNNEIVDAEVL